MPRGGLCPLSTILNLAKIGLLGVTKILVIKTSNAFVRSSEKQLMQNLPRCYKIIFD